MGDDDVEGLEEVVNKLKRKRDETSEMSTNLTDHYDVITGFPTTSHLLSWLKRNEYEVFSEGKLSATQKRHIKECPAARVTSLAGGKYHFPASEKAEFLRHLATDIEMEDSPAMFWNQIAFEDEGARLIIDVDSDETVLSDTMIEKLSSTLWKTLKDYYSNFDQCPIDIFVSKCGPRLKKGKVSTGLHMVAHVRVSFEQAAQLIYGYKLRLHTDSTINMTGLEVDAGIYRASSKQVSLRMIYSRKIENCPICHGPKNEAYIACKFCDSKGKVSTKKTYEPLCCINPKTGTSDDKYFYQRCANYLQLVQCYSIWAEPTDSSHCYEKPIGDPVVDMVAQKPSNPPSSRHQMKKIRRENPSYKLIESFIRNVIWDGKKIWEHTIVQNISLTENQKSAYIQVSGLNSSQCPYVNKDHGGNRIYFVMNQKGELTVHCHSDKVEYGCKTKPRIRFQMASDVINEVFGMNLSGNVIHFSGKNPRELRGPEFILCQSNEKRTREQQQADKEKHEKERKLKKVKETYHLA